MKPVIGINGSWSLDGASPPLISVRETYVHAVAGAGGIPVVLPVIGDSDIIAQQVEACDGFVFVGGPDLHPKRWGEEIHPTTGLVAPPREEYDFALIQQVLDARKPFLGICLGCQEINVAFGGTLIQDIHSELETSVRHCMKQAPFLNRHDVTVEPGTRLSGLLGGVERISTNSAHHQAVRDLGPGLVLSARAEDGIIEAFEVENYPFGLAIQWHPEYLQAEEEHRKLFEGLVAASRERRLATASTL